MSSRTRSTSSRSTPRGCVVAMWLVPFLGLVAWAYAMGSIAAAAIVCAVFAVVLFVAWRARQRPVTLPPDTGPNLPRIDSCLPAGWLSAGARYNGGGSTGSW